MPGDLPRMSKWLIASLFLCLGLPGNLRAADVEITADPAVIRLTGPNASYSLLIHGKTADGRLVDLTHTAHYRSGNPKLATVSDAGVVRAVADGSTTIHVDVSGRSLSVAVTVEGTTAPRVYH